MNFYPPPPVIEAKIWVRIPDHLRCTGQPTEWRSGSARPFSGIFLEGPTADAQGNLFVTDIPYGRILKIDQDKDVTECVRYDGEPNGMAIREDGRFVVADYKQGLLLFDPATNTIAPHLTRRNLERFKGPNDLIVVPTPPTPSSTPPSPAALPGDIFFTDQGQTGMTDPTGAVYRLSTSSSSPPNHRPPSTTANTLTPLLTNGPSPNGLALSPDHRALYVAMTRANSVWRLPLHADGTTSKASLFFQAFGVAGPDGLAVDEEGSVFICHPSLGCVFVVDAEGVGKCRIVSDKAGGWRNLTNCTFGGRGNRMVYVTDSVEGIVQVVEWHCAGAVWPRASREVGAGEGEGRGSKL